MIGRRFHSTPDRRQGFTLMEVMLTLCLLVIIASLAWPTLDKPFANQRLRKSADLIRAEWGEARVEALNSGLTYIFQFTIGGDRYRIQRQAAPETPPDAEYDDTSTDPSTALQFDAESAETEHTLPEGVTFVNAKTALDSRAATVESEADVTLSMEETWSEPILFFPDGTTSTARLILQNRHNRCIELNLRGLTGVVKVGEVYTDEDGLR